LIGVAAILYPLWCPCSASAERGFFFAGINTMTTVKCAKCGKPHDSLMSYLSGPRVKVWVLCGACALLLQSAYEVNKDPSKSLGPPQSSWELLLDSGAAPSPHRVVQERMNRARRFRQRAILDAGAEFTDTGATDTGPAISG
jgi:hypothetical protein